MNRSQSESVPAEDSLAAVNGTAGEDFPADTLAAQFSPPSDSLVGVILEQARLHFVSAISAQASGDSLRCAAQFEEAISLLNQLSYFPGIEENQDFDDLSAAVIEDYESYIASIDSLGPDASIFALREKLNQLSEKPDSVSVTLPGELVTSSDIPLEINSLVEQNIAFFQGKGREHMERWLQRSGTYFPIMKEIMKEEGAPEELVYLSMVESGLNPSARSWARAVGMWQFMKGTGKLYGLDVSYWYDERRDFEKATRAAARHLMDLHEEFSDWYLALAAYNSGAGRVYTAMRRSSSGDFWKLRKHLPRETRNYVPQYIAVTLIGLNPSAFGFSGIEPSDPLNYEVVTIDDCVDLDVLADCAGSDVETIRELNPELIRWCTPSDFSGYKLRIPGGTSNSFMTAYSSLPEDQKRNYAIHVVRKGETLGGIARKYSVSISLLQETNGIRNPRLLSVGKELRIPVPRSGVTYAATERKTAPAARRVPKAHAPARPLASAQRAAVPADPKNKDKLVYRVKKGDTLGHIAEWYECRAADIRNWNNLSYGRPIYPGQELAIWVDASRSKEFGNVSGSSFSQNQARTKDSGGAGEGENGHETVSYRVRPGDSLDKISAKHGVTVEQLMRWNRLSSSLIRVGQELVIYPDAVEVAAMQSAFPGRSGSQSDLAEATRYRVKKGDTLWDIARAFNVRATDLREWNNLRASTIYAGQELLIYNGGATQ